MRILVAPDKFKDSLGAREVANSIAEGLRDVMPNATIEIAPVADGGDSRCDLPGLRRRVGGVWCARCARARDRGALRLAARPEDGGDGDE